MRLEKKSVLVWSGVIVRKETDWSLNLAGEVIPDGDFNLELKLIELIGASVLGDVDDHILLVVKEGLLRERLINRVDVADAIHSVEGNRNGRTGIEVETED